MLNRRPFLLVLCPPLSPAGFWRGRTRVGPVENPRAGSAPWCSQGVMQGGNRGLGSARGTQHTRPSWPHLSHPVSVLTSSSCATRRADSWDSDPLLHPRTRATSPGPRRLGRGGAGRGAAWQEAARTFRCRRSRWLQCGPGPQASCARAPITVSRRSSLGHLGHLARPHGPYPRRHIL